MADRIGGGGRIRTHGTLSSTAVFKSEDRTLPKLTKSLNEKHLNGLQDRSDYQDLPEFTKSTGTKTETW